MNRPNKNEYNPYFERYLKLVDEGNYFDLQKQNTLDVIQVFGSIPIEKHDFSYAPDKWNVKQMLAHIIDTERVFSFRALVCARADIHCEIQNMDHNVFAQNALVHNRTLHNLLNEFEAVRKTSEFLFANISNEQSSFLMAGKYHVFTARALAYIIIGHANHHLQVLKEKYL